MKASKFTEAQKAFILKRVEEGTSVAAICSKAGDQPGDLLQLEETVGGLLPDEMHRLKALEE